MDKPIARVGNFLYTPEGKEDEVAPIPPIPYKWINFNIFLVGLLLLISVITIFGGVYTEAADNYIYQCHSLPHKEMVETTPEHTAYYTGTKVIEYTPPQKQESTPREDCYDKYFMGVNNGIGFIGVGALYSFILAVILCMMVSRKHEIEEEHYVKYPL